jgi:hypothetical protein
MPQCPYLLQQGRSASAGLHRSDVMLPLMRSGLMLTAADEEQVLLLLQGRSAEPAAA